MPRNERDFQQRIRAAFRTEALEHLQVIGQRLVAMESAPASVGGDPEAIETVFRHTHSLKGAARAAEYHQVELLCQALEDVFSDCRRGRMVLEAAHFDLLHRAFDLAGALAATETEIAEDMAASVRGLVRSLGACAQGGAPGDDAAPAPAVAIEEADADLDAGASRVSAAAQAAPASGPRMSAPGLDRLLFAVEDMLPARQRHQELAHRLRELGGDFDAWDKQWATLQRPLRKLRRDVAATDADPSLRQVLRYLDWSLGQVDALEQRVDALARDAAEGAEALARQVDGLLAQSKDLLLLPFATLADLMPKIVRDLARSKGKRVDLRVEGGEVLVDKRLLDHLKDPLLHLLRNAVDHGIETPAQRRAAGKPETGTIVVSARMDNGGTIEIAVADDGRGIDATAVRQAAVQRGLLAEEAAQVLDAVRTADLVFRPDVSTRARASDLSGRGMGLAIVRESVERLGGQAIVDMPENAAGGAGTRFRLLLPQTFGAFRGLFVRIADEDYVIPTLHVAGVARVRRSDIRTVRDRDTVDWMGRIVPIQPLAALLERNAGEMPDGVLVSVFIEAGSDCLAVVVDDVLDEDDVLVKSLARPLLRVRNVAAATIDASGRVVPVLNAGDLVKSARRPRAATAGGTPAPRTRAGDTRILLAEDSITSRLLLKGILEAAGYEVRTAVDGIDALTALRTEAFDVLVSDVEMPRLNGFDLTARVRSDPLLSTLPVILVTALSKREERERGIDVGANAYITKGGFDQRQLIDAVRRLARMQERR